MKLLNLDEVSRPERYVKIKGEEYAVAEQTVGTMIEAIRVAKEAEKQERDEVAIFESMVRTCRSILPSCPEHILHSLDVKKMGALIEFVSASDEEVIEGSEVETTEEEETEGKPD